MSKDYIITRFDLDFIGRTFPTPKGGTITVTGVHGVDKNRTKIFNSTCSICSKDKELYPDPFTCLKDHLLKGSVPCGCSKNPALNESQRTIIIKRILSEEKYTFNGFVDGYKNKKSVFTYECPDHGTIKTTYNNFNKGRRCPHCLGSGFNPDIPSSLYLVQWYNESGKSWLKYGITNKTVKQRVNQQISNHKSKTGETLSHHIINVVNDSGYVVQNLEKIIGNLIQKYGNACTKSDMTDGYTETLPLESYSDIMDIIKGED